MTSAEQAWAWGLALTILILPAPALAEPLSMTPADMLGWESRTFAGSTHYNLEQRDNQTLLRADCSNGASALYLQQRVDLSSTPILKWSWAIEDVFSGIDETSKAGDDYPVRLYVVKSGGLLAWRSKAINYVWSSTQPAGSDWPNAYTGNAHMLALRSGRPEAVAELVREKRNVREDFLAYHGIDLGSIDGIAIMTDCDNSRQSVTGWYGSISWHAPDD